MTRAEYHSKVGIAWKEETCQVVAEDAITGFARLFSMPDGHFRCRYCLASVNVVRLDTRGFAACENCGMIYNEKRQIDPEMSNREKKRRLEKLKYDSRRYLP